MKNILFATEFSEHAGEVFKYAADFAFFFKARLVVLHVSPKAEIRLHVADNMEKKSALVTEKLKSFVDLYMPDTHKKSIEVEYVSVTGFAGETIMKIASEQNIDLIVMGMRAKEPLKNIFGSTSLQVLTESDCPVLVVPREAKLTSIENIVYTTNFEFRDLGAINMLSHWSKIFESKVHCFHVAEPKDEMYTTAKNMKIIKDTFAGREDLSFAMAEGDLRKEIHLYTQNTNADILAMMTHKRNFVTRMLKSNVVTDIALRIKIPMLIIKDNAYEWDTEMDEWVRIVNAIA